ncbi:MAG: cytochrome c assembly protein, partial [Saprospiraceae bacterium]
MQEIQYIGEHLWLGELGHLFIITSFVSALLASVAYFLSVRGKVTTVGDGWKKIGRYAFYTHGATLFGLMALIFYAMYNHMYEYSYVFDHVSEDLPLKYILSAFWEGQEG